MFNKCMPENIGHFFVFLIAKEGNEMTNKQTKNMLKNLKPFITNVLIPFITFVCRRLPIEEYN